MLRLFSPKPKIAVVLHIFYEDVALDIIERLSGAKSDFTLFVTHNRALSVPVMLRLHDLRRPIVFLMTDNVGRDIWPFFEALRHPAMQRHDILCKLHTKRGHDKLHIKWRDEMFGRVIGTGEVFDAAAKAMLKDRSILMAGPEKTFISAKKFMYENAAGVAALTSAMKADMSEDWGFFAGTMFWARRAVFDPLLPLVSEKAFYGDNSSEDGEFAHALERAIGLLGRSNVQSVGVDGSLKAASPGKTSIRNTFDRQPA